MVLPKMGASFVMKKIADEVMAEPKALVESAIADVSQAATGSPRAAASPQIAPASLPQERDEIDGQTINDESGEVIGTARRMRQIALYLVSDSYGDFARELEACLTDDESRRYLLHDDRGRLTGIVYAPHPDRMPQKAEAIRADDI